ncbi:leucine-rich repeat domain-containing protein [Tenacibaculum singaporense]|uniref:hypothetical protein n=1 Tax=Tenacibaculum singaporense TaxID=2358479 RepID=UPI000F66A141|nr:hypothetical protein [Tenacibaculum singaporense]RSC93338.1 hypothetical protein EI424_08920 [Tenacibaculum singaporense]
MEKKRNNILVIVLLSLIMISCSSEDSNIETQTIHIPDANFETYLIDNGIDSDGIINQKVLLSDVKNVECINLITLNSEKRVRSLKGIEGFSNLKRLFAVDNNLTKIDLSKNIMLDTINLMSNNLVDIKGLQNLTNLKWLNLSFNFFEEFTLNNSSVTNILMTHNELKSFKANKAINLETVNLLSNKIDLIDFSKNTKLQLINVSNNKLTNIVLGLKEELFYLSLFENSLTNLNVSDFDKLSYLIVERNPKLFCIKVKKGQNIPLLKLSNYQKVNENCI